MTPADITKDPEKMEQTYKEALRVYKMQVDEILTQQSELTYDLQNHELRVHQARDENERTFDEFLEREKEVAVGLVYEKTGRKITDKIMDVLTHRQMARTKVLARGRRGYIFLQHVLEDLMARLRFAETLGEGMTTMDYEVLHVANIGYKDRLDERNQELEKLRIKIAETVNGVAQYKEKEVCLLEDIDYEDRSLADYREANTRARERVNQLHLMLNETRDQFNEKKVEAGLMVARQALLEMERMMKLKNSVTKDIAKLEHEIESFKSAKEVLKSKSKLRSTLSRNIEPF
ncbi:coiled-coil domain-containing protein 113-like [Hylaeus volcanicus]|uniref:coiled-coil domain-containing protein 113-like n=1 Tax=Hylaeus volcanicus TaxID=313075 RepID=UPI0023B81F7D|nr:coiled-coil domain-containing protein 113-like [Hylaeus volcanicus]